MTNIKDMLVILFPKSDTVDIEYVANIIEFKCQNFGLNTPLRIAHFLAQVREEVGAELKPISENLNYSEEALINIFKAFRNNPELADKFGRDEDTPIADQVSIANIAYANRNGNGAADSDGDGDIDADDDGWKYRGAGALQITGKGNYIEVQKRIDKYIVGNSVNILNGKDIHTLKGSILAAAGFWIWKDIYKDADLGVDSFAVDHVTARINKHTDSYENRKSHFEKIKHLI